MKIKTKITVTVFLMSSAAMVVLTALGYRYLSHTFKETIFRQHTTILTLAQRHIDDEVRRSRDVLEAVARSIDPDELEKRAALQRKLETFKSASPFFDGGLQVVDARGYVVAEAPLPAGAPPGRHKADPAVAAGLAGRPQVSSPYGAGADKHPTVAFTFPIARRDGSIAGVVAGLDDLLVNDSLTDYSQVSMGAKGRLFLVDKNHTIVMHPDRRRIMQQVPPGTDSGLDRAIRTGRSAYGEMVDSLGEPMVTAARPLSNVPWLVAIQYPADEVYSPLKDARTFYLAMLSFTLLAIFGAIRLALRLLVRRITAPLLRMTEQVRALPSKRGAERRITLSTGDELDGLAGAVNTMIGEMDHKQEILAENRELYRIIADFTSELALLLNPDRSVRYISANCLALTGYPHRDFLQSAELLDSLVHPDDRALWQKIGDCTLECDTSQAELRLITKDGVTRWFSYSCHRVTDPDGSLLAVRGSFRDINRFRELESALEEQRQFLESLLENTSTPLFVIDRDHRVIFWNRAVVELSGLTAEQMLGTDQHWRVAYPEKRPTLCDLVMDGKIDLLESYYRSISKDSVMPGMFRAEGWFPNLNGKDRYIFFDAAPVKRNGETVAVVETLYDITDRARAEQSLRLFSQAVEQSASSIVITDRNGTIEYVNERFCLLTGYSREEAIGGNPRILQSGTQNAELYRELWETITSGHEWHGELQNRKKDGSLFWESALISPVYDQDGILTHFLGVKEDITARKLAERELLKKQAELVVKHEQLGNLFRQVEKGKREWEQSMDGIEDMVAMADSDGKIRRCNLALRKLVCCPDNELNSSHWRDLLRRADLDPDRVDVQNGEVFHEPSRRWFTLKVYPYGDEGGEVIMLHDLTQIKEVSQQLAAAYQELKATHSQLLHQEKMASIGQLAAGVAHEINNPIGFISSNISTMQKYLDRLTGFLAQQSAGLEQVAPPELKEELSEARRKLKIDHLLLDSHSLLAESQEGAERVRVIVQNLKSFSRVDEAQASWVDLNECLESTINIAWNELKYKTTLVRDYGELPAIKCHPQQLNQVFLNMLVNAAHAIETRGEITVSSRREGDLVAVAISDTGGGIPEEIRSRIFEPFFTTKAVGKGTGLGLSISYDIIEKHGGSIEVESSPAGTTFTIRLPIEGV